MATKELAKDIIEQLKSAIADARKREISFALCLGKEAATTVLATHKTKDAEAMKREAKQKGETSKLAWGTMAVEGKTVKLSCVEPDVPAGLARKTREMLKLAGLKSKIQLLDSAGNILEEDADPEDGDGPEDAAADPQAEKWAAEKARLDAALEQAAATPGVDLTAARAALAAAAEKAAAGDAAGALVAVPDIDKAIADAAAAVKLAAEDKVRWEQSAAKLKPMIDATVAAGSALAGKISAVWSFAQGKAGGPNPDFGAAIKSIPMLVKLIQDSRAEAGAAAPQSTARGDGPEGGAQPALVGKGAGAAPDAGSGSAPVDPAAKAAPSPGALKPPEAAPTGAAPPADPLAAPGGKDKPADPKVGGKEKFDKAETALKEADAAIAAYLAMIPGSAEVAPVSWTTARGKADATLAPMRAPAAAFDDKALDGVLKDLATLMIDIKAKSAVKTEWKKSLDLFNLRLVPVERHAQAGAVPQIKPKVDAIKADRDKAVAKADKQDFKGAATELQALYKRCDEVEVLADALAHYNNILAHRQTVVNAHLGVVTGVADVDKLLRAQEKLLTDAQALAAAEKFADAVKKLDEIPPVEDKLQVIFNRKSSYDSFITACDTKIAAIDALPAPTKAVLAADIAKWKTDYGNCKVATTKDYEVSARLIAPLHDRVTFLQTSLAAAGTYLTALTPFEAQFKTFTDHKGRPGIEEQYLAMERDLTGAKTEAAAGKHSTATALLNRSKPTWPAMTKGADDYLAYLTKRDAVAKTIADLKAKAGAATGLAQAEGLMATAATQAVNKDFTGALANVTEAEKRAADAKAGADATEGLGKLKDGAALDGMAADFDKAFKVFTDMRANVAGKDPAGAFAALLTAADTEAQKAKDEKAKPAPDFAKARGFLDAAIKLLEDALPKIMAKGPYDTHLTAAKALAGTLPAKNADDCIKGAITTVNTRITEAEALAKAPGFDFAGAEAKLAEAKSVADKATADAGLWPTIKADKASTTAVKTLITGQPAAIVTLLAKRSADVDAILKEIDDKVKAGDFKAAAAAAARGKALAGPTAADIATCAAFNTNRTNWYTGWLPTITGPGTAAGGPALVKAQAKLAAAEAAMASGNYDGGLNMLDEVSWAVQECDAAIKGDKAYEPERVKAAAAIKSVADIRNAGVEDKLKPIEKDYADGVALATAKKFVPATAAMTAIPPKATPLVAVAQAFKLYDDARKLADDKLKLAEGHKNAAAIQPVLTRLRARYDAAVKQAAAGEAAKAKTEMDAILAEATTAIKTADTSAAFADQADKVGDAGPTPAMVAEAKKMLADLKALPQAPAAKPDLDTATIELGSLDASGVAPDVAKAHFKAATDALVRAEVAIQQAKMVAGSIKAARDQIAALKGHAQKDYIATEIGKLDAEVKDLDDQAVKPGNSDMATTNLESTMTSLAEAKTLADQQAAYLASRATPEVEPMIETLEKHKQRYAIKANIDTMKAKLKSATDQSAAKKPAEAMKLCQEVKDLALSSRVMADMRENDATKPPKVADIKAILAQPNGQAQLDAMMSELEPNAKRAILRVAFEARFGCKLKDFADAARTVETADGTLDGPNIQRFYEIMSHLPDKDVVLNDSMREFQITPGGGSFYEGGSNKKVVMNEGSAVLSSAYKFGQEQEVGGADPGCEPANNDEVSFFSWNTLHEVGHAVDDKHGFMDKNAGNATYGGWQSHGRNVKPVATVLAAHFKFDETYISQYMAHNANPAMPPPPGGTQPEDWESRRVAVRAWIDMASVGNNPWSNKAVATRLAIGGTVYHESYPNSWSSYSLAARAQGMTGYQFRAPGEWFAELYAAFHAGKLKKTHPAAAWLEAL